MLKKPNAEGTRSSTMLAVSPAALYYRGASLPPSPARGLSATLAPAPAPVVFEDGMAGYGYGVGGAGSSMLGLSLDSHKTRERSLPPPVSKAHRVLGHDLAIATQPRRHTYPDDLLDDHSSVATRSSIDDENDDDDRASFVDFGSDENQSTARPFSITSIDSAIPTFAASSREQRRVSPSSPTAIIPTFSASAVLMMSSRQHQQPPPPHHRPSRRDLPPTTNVLSNADRTDLLRKHKKLAQVLGESVASVHPFAAAEPVDTAQWPPLRHRDTIYVSASHNSRRHSAPLSPSSGQLEFLRSLDAGSRTSFVDMDDDDTPASGTNSRHEVLAPSKRSRDAESMISLDSLSSAITASTTATASSGTPRRLHRMRSISVDLVASPPGSPLGWTVIAQHNAPPSLPPQLTEEERRQKRAKLVKLHRFLGSRVPPELVLGIRAEDGLPPVAPDEEDAPASPASPGRMKATWMHIRQSTRGSRGSRSGSTSPALELDDPLNACELDDRERMINVKRAQKMEKLFGALPPQTLYHTRSMHVDTTRVQASSAPSTPRALRGRTMPVAASESRERLLRPSLDGYEEERMASGSPEFRHYQQSISSLGAMIDRGDRESLMELFDYVNEQSDDEDAIVSSHASVASGERRLSLPPTPSTAAYPADPRAFGARRRRAAKLAQFFGVGYRELFGDVLDSIEMGVRDEAKRGSLRPDEVQELMSRLRALKSRGADMDHRFGR